MNTPNKLTLLRILLSPIFLGILLWANLPYRYFLACVIFVIASVTDLLDGKLARKNNQITNFGKFLDPLADKMLVCAALLGFIELRICTAWIPMIILTREFLVTSIRLVVSNQNGKVIAASIWGKTKTVSQMTTIILILLLKQVQDLTLLPEAFPYATIFTVALWLTTALTIVSGAQYFWEHRSLLKP